MYVYVYTYTVSLYIFVIWCYLMLYSYITFPHPPRKGVLLGLGTALLRSFVLEPLRLPLHPHWLHARLVPLVHGGALLLRCLGFGGEFEVGTV